MKFIKCCLEYSEEAEGYLKSVGYKESSNVFPTSVEYINVSVGGYMYYWENKPKSTLLTLEVVKENISLLRKYHGIPTPPSSTYEHQSTKEETIMTNYNGKAVAKPTLIFGKDTLDMTDADYLEAIRRIQQRIKDYDDIKNSSKINAKVKQLKVELTEVTALFDAPDNTLS